jgi:hypothetical protein
VKRFNENKRSLKLSRRWFQRFRVVTASSDIRKPYVKQDLPSDRAPRKSIAAVMKMSLKLNMKRFTKTSRHPLPWIA